VQRVQRFRGSVGQRRRGQPDQQTTSSRRRIELSPQELLGEPSRLGRASGEQRQQGGGRPRLFGEVGRQFRRQPLEHGQRLGRPTK
jgi:hypothetical protein